VRMRFIVISFFCGSIVIGLAAPSALAQTNSVDSGADTWVATDGLGRSVPNYEQVGPPRKNRYIGIFYFLWLGQHGTDSPYDISKILANHPDAMSKPTSPPWGPLHYPHHWGESLFGYYFSDDAWVLRKHAQMLSDAGVDVVIFDVTNQVTYRKCYEALGRVFSEVRRDGGRTPQMAFLTPFWDPARVVSKLYKDLYEPGLYRDLWFRWKGKPLILADPDKVDPALRDFFTFRKPQPDYFKGPTGPDQWGWLEIHPQHVFRNSAGEAEQMTVGIAQNGSGKRLCAFSEPDTYGRSWHGGAKDSRPDAVNDGLNFAEQWERALKIDPQFIFITGWNEWIAGRFAKFNKVSMPVMFVDAFTQEYSRDIEPMKGGHADHYYYQMVSSIRRYKGVRQPPKADGPRKIAIDGQFDDWANVAPEYRDDKGDTIHRDHPSHKNIGQYVNNTGRNDLVVAKVAYDADRVYFYIRTAEPIKSHNDEAWMMLFIDVDSDHRTGWEGYDFVVDRRVKDGTTTVLERSTGGWEWTRQAELNYRVKDRELELAVDRLVLGFDRGPSVPRFDFKWSDNAQQTGDVLTFITDGDSAPNGRFNYRFESRR